VTLFSLDITLVADLAATAVPNSSDLPCGIFTPEVLHFFAKLSDPHGIPKCSSGTIIALVLPSVAREVPN
jgi:hypothetical protein